MSRIPPYPPCYSGTCIDRPCCALGNRISWPETVGQDADVAINLIHQTNPLVTVVRVAQGEPILDDFCCNRVYLFVGPNNKVALAPQVG